MASIARIPLFPLGVVLYPGMWLPLQIFEERYKTMLADCQMVEGQFGIVLIREGSEVGPPAQPYAVGTLTRIAKAVPLPNGRFFIQTQGLRRFRITEKHHDKPYLEGTVEYLESLRPDGERARAALPRVVERYKAYVDAVRALGGQIEEAPHTRHEPEFFSWLVAATLLIGPELQQELLEIDDVGERLEREADLLDETLRVLRNRAERKAGGRPGNLPFSLN